MTAAIPIPELLEVRESIRSLVRAMLTRKSSVCGQFKNFPKLHFLLKKLAKLDPLDYPPFPTGKFLAMDFGESISLKLEDKTGKKPIFVNISLSIRSNKTSKITNAKIITTLGRELDLNLIASFGYSRTKSNADHKIPYVVFLILSLYKEGMLIGTIKYNRNTNKLNQFSLKPGGLRANAQSCLITDEGPIMSPKLERRFSRLLNSPTVHQILEEMENLKKGAQISECDLISLLKYLKIPIKDVIFYPAIKITK